MKTNFFLFLLDGGNIPEKISFRIASISARIVSLTLLPIYTGAILSLILFPLVKIPFTNPKEFVEDGSYKIGSNELLLNDTFGVSNNKIITFFVAKIFFILIFYRGQKILG